MTKRLAFMLAASLGLGACAGSGTARVEYASVTVRSPELVTIDDDVYVLADADEPVFYADDSYWLYRDDRWYRSRSYDRDWVYVSSPSPRVRRINEPTAYVRYRSRNQEARNTPRPAPAPVRERWRDDLREQQPLQPTQPQQPAQPYPRPPQQELVRPTAPGHDRDHAKPPAGGTKVQPPGPPANHDVRTHDRDERDDKRKREKEDKKDKKRDH
jgi:hypothetical protein